jgi:hypothetical protein
MLVTVAVCDRDVVCIPELEAIQAQPQGKCQRCPIGCREHRGDAGDAVESALAGVAHVAPSISARCDATCRSRKSSIGATERAAAVHGGSSRAAGVQCLKSSRHDAEDAENLKALAFFAGLLALCVESFAHSRF